MRSTPTKEKKTLGPNCANVHNHYMVLNAHGAENITVA